MSFFVKACVSALQQYQGINAYIDGTESRVPRLHGHLVAVGTPKGLVVPVLRERRHR